MSTPRRILIVDLFPYLAHHHETGLELAARHLEAGDEVIGVDCAADLPVCYANPSGDRGICLLCASRRRRGRRLLPGAMVGIGLHRLDAAERREVAAIDGRFPSQEALAAYTIDGFDIGMAALSSLISALRCPRLDVAAQAGRIRAELRSGLIAYRSIRRHLRELRPDLVYVFNGRFSACRGAVRACQAEGVAWTVHERGCDRDHFALFPGALACDLEANRKQIDACWDRLDEQSRSALARGFYERQAGGDPLGWFSYTAAQQRGALPPGWDPTRRNVAVFTTSEDEFAALGPAWRSPIASDQHAAMRGLLDRLHAVGWPADLRIYIRLHPNMARMCRGEVERWRQLHGGDVVVIAPEDACDSYALVLSSAAVLTFGSTIGAESAYWGRPTLLAGMSLYAGLPGLEPAADLSEVEAFVRCGRAAPDRRGAEMYGCFLATFGEPYRHYRPTSLGFGPFRGREIHPGIAARLLRLLHRALPGWLAGAIAVRDLLRALRGGR